MLLVAAVGGVVLGSHARTQEAHPEQLEGIEEAVGRA